MSKPHCSSCSSPSPTSARQRRTTVARRAALLLLLAAVTRDAMPQGALRGPQTADAGSTIRIEVACNEPSVEVVDVTTGTVRSYVVAFKVAEIQVPPVPPGTIVIVRIGRGRNAHFLFVSVT
ncbi:MAG: hypothetical protein KDC98_14740 [Planctomycetes bacterium]|nr:hypothetical protein [Planctomycetota bacterium]